MNNNGVVSFDTAVPGFTPTPFPITGSALLSPYWGDVDTRGTGNVYHRATSDSGLLASVSQEIRSIFTEFEAPNTVTPFVATYLYIATWDHVGYFSSHTDRVCFVKSRVTCFQFYFLFV